MIERKYVIVDPVGFHARPAGALAKVLKPVASTITVEKDGKTADMKKLMKVMGLGIKQGNEITVTIDGADEADVAALLDSFLKEKSPSFSGRKASLFSFPPFPGQWLKVTPSGSLFREILFHIPEESVHLLVRADGDAEIIPDEGFVEVADKDPICPHRLKQLLRVRSFPLREDEI